MRACLKFIGVCVAPLIGSFGFCAGAHAQFYLSNADLGANFLGVAVGRHDDSSDRRIVKWTAPIRFGLAGENTGHIAPKVRDHVAHLRMFTSHPIDLVEAKDANFIILRVGGLDPLGRKGYAAVARRFFPDDATWEEHLDRADRFGCSLFNRFRSDGTGGLHAVIAAAREGPTLNSICIVHGTTAGLGIRNRLPSGTYSIFGHPQLYYDITLQDIFFLRILYHPMIRPLMTRPVLEPIVRQILNEFRPGH